MPAPSRAWLVMITGEPGSGKTSLGIALSRELRVPFLNRDTVRGGLLATAGLWKGELRDPPERERAVDAFVELIEAAARLGITHVIEFVVTPERRPAFRRIQEAAHCLVVVTRSHNARARSERRDRYDPLLDRPGVLSALGYRTIDDYLADPERARVAAQVQTDFDLPMLSVDTTDGYDPSLDSTVEWIVDETRAPRSGVEFGG